jgi:hypothetical protein
MRIPDCPASIIVDAKERSAVLMPTGSFMMVQRHLESSA